MALKLLENYKGISAEYWKILDFSYNARNNTTSVNLALYFSEETRKEGKENFLKMEHFYFEGELKREDIYTKIKESKLEEIEQPEVIDEETGEALPIEKKYKETNKFLLAEDC